MKKKVLIALRRAGFDVDLWYDRSASQWVFFGEQTQQWAATGTLVYKLSDLTISQWVQLAEDMEKNKGY